MIKSGVKIQSWLPTIAFNVRLLLVVDGGTLHVLTGVIYVSSLVEVEPSKYVRIWGGTQSAPAAKPNH